MTSCENPMPTDSLGTSCFGRAVPAVVLPGALRYSLRIPDMRLIKSTPATLTTMLFAGHTPSRLSNSWSQALTSDRSV